MCYLIHLGISILFYYALKYRYRFPPLNPLWHKVLGLVMIVLGIMGWCGNGVVVYIFLITPSLRTPSNLLVVNLAFSDFIMMGFMCPPMVICCFYETWVLGKYKNKCIFVHNCEKICSIFTCKKTFLCRNINV